MYPAMYTTYTVVQMLIVARYILYCAAKPVFVNSSTSEYDHNAPIRHPFKHGADTSAKSCEEGLMSKPCLEYYQEYEGCCQECKRCHPGYGKPKNDPCFGDCIPCIEGDTFNPDYAHFCQKCEGCYAKRIVHQECTVISNRICSEECEPGYFRPRNNVGYEDSCIRCHWRHHKHIDICRHHFSTTFQSTSTYGPTSSEEIVLVLTESGDTRRNISISSETLSLNKEQRTEPITSTFSTDDYGPGKWVLPVGGTVFCTVTVVAICFACIYHEKLECKVVFKKYILHFNCPCYIKRKLCKKAASISPGSTDDSENSSGLDEPFLPAGNHENSVDTNFDVIYRDKNGHVHIPLTVLTESQYGSLSEMPSLGNNTSVISSLPESNTQFGSSGRRLNYQANPNYNQTYVKTIQQRSVADQAHNEHNRSIHVPASNPQQFQISSLGLNTENQNALRYPRQGANSGAIGQETTYEVFVKGVLKITSPPFQPPLQHAPSHQQHILVPERERSINPQQPEQTSDCTNYVPVHNSV